MTGEAEGHAGAGELGWAPGDAGGVLKKSLAHPDSKFLSQGWKDICLYAKVSAALLIPSLIFLETLEDI